MPFVIPLTFMRTHMICASSQYNCYIRISSITSRTYIIILYFRAFYTVHFHGIALFLQFSIMVQNKEFSVGLKNCCDNPGTHNHQMGSVPCVQGMNNSRSPAHEEEHCGRVFDPTYRPHMCLCPGHDSPPYRRSGQ